MMRKRSWKTRLRGWKMAVVFSLLAAVLVILISYFVDAWYAYRLTGYNPLDRSRGEKLKQEHRTR